MSSVWGRIRFFASDYKKTSLILFILLNLHAVWRIWTYCDNTINGIFNDYTFSFKLTASNSYYNNFNRILSLNGKIMDNGPGQIAPIISCIILPEWHREIAKKAPLHIELNTFTCFNFFITHLQYSHAGYKWNFQNIKASCFIQNLITRKQSKNLCNQKAQITLLISIFISILYFGKQYKNTYFIMLKPDIFQYIPKTSNNVYC